MLQINKEFLKELLFENIKVDCLNVRASTNSFVFEFSPNKKSIIYSDHTISIGGFGCWNNETDEDTESRTKLKSNSFDESSIGDLINNLIIQDYEFPSYGLSVEDYEFIDYYYNNFITNYSFDKFIETSYTNDDEDHYGNHNVLRTMIIDIEQLADYIMNFKYSKPFEELSKNLVNLTEQNIVEITYRPHIFQNILDEEIKINDTKKILKSKI